MINSKELRLGNLVQRYGSLCTVESLDSSTITVIGEDFYLPCEPEEINGIPITCELIERLGFKRTRNDLGWRNGMMQITDYGNIKGTYGTLIVKKGFIQSVHQLQNLFFALTGEELTRMEETK